ncbi:hypothetical protein HA402_013127 [Bradysia odoriphaga]|nr:hypothetical protein HA402_013127 [Bradysia odoriphaga]
MIKNLLDNSATFDDLKNDSPENDWSTLPYPEGAVIAGKEKYVKSDRPKQDPRDVSIILFPGQGAHHVGMCKNLMKFPGARDIFELANDVLKYDLLKLCLEGPKDKLDRTEYCQPAIVVSSLAALERLKEERPNAIDNCVATAGFSLGEITALIFAGAIPFDKGLRLVQVRAEAMQLAAEQVASGMATVLFGPDTDLKGACAKAVDWCISKGIENPECRVANYLYPHCKVVAGNTEALHYLEVNAKHLRLRRIKRIPVSGAFHTELMAPAVEPFKKALKKITISEPIINVHSCVDGLRYKNVGHILQQLPTQIVRPVKWEQMLHVLYQRNVDDRFPRTFECGPGRGLTTILKQVNAKAWDNAFNIDT